MAALDADRDLGHLGAVPRGDTIAGLRGLFEKAGAEPVRSYGVRVFTDHLGDHPSDASLPDVLRREEEASRRDSYRSVAGLIHLIGTKATLLTTVRY